MGSKGITIGVDASRANKEQKTGVEWYAFFLIEELKKLTMNDERLAIVLYSDKPLKGKLANLPSNWESKVLSWPPKRFWTQIRLSWEMLTNKPDILFIPAHVFPFVHPKKTVMTVHDVAALQFPQSYNWFERWYSVWSAKLALKKLWNVIVPSQFTKKELKTDKAIVIPHGYDKRYKKIEHENDSVLKKYRITKPFLLSVGRLETKKNTARLIEAFDGLSKEYQLVLIGKPGHGYEDVQRAYEESPHKDRIIMPGYVDPEDVVGIMNAAEAFVFPSLYEGFGMPILEALACGTPVVAAQGSSLEEVGNTFCEYVDPLSVESITQGIENVLQNEEIKKQRIAGGLEHVKQFSWQRCAQQTLDVLMGR